jgi:hypothetical protein
MGGGAATGGGSNANVDAGAVRPLGANLPNLFHYYLGLAPGDASSARALMDAARAEGFTHARFIAAGFWPADMTRPNGWKTNPTAYWAAFDQMVADARARGLRLVPSMLFNLWMWVDLSQSTMGQVFTPGTPARLLVEQYIRELVTRYANEPAIAMWEMGNELNLEADLDHSTCNVCDGGTNGCGGLAPSLGTACSRSAADNYFSCNNCRAVTTSQQDLGAFTESIAVLVKSLDALHRPFTTGNGYPRASAWHLAASPCPNCDWTLDSPTEYQLALQQLHPTDVDYICVHHYGGPEAARFGDVDEAGGIALLDRTAHFATSIGKKLYVGEYGEARGGSIMCGGTQVCGGDPDAVSTRRMEIALVKDDVPLSALWSFEFHQFCAGVPQCTSIEAGDSIMPFVTRAESASGTCAGQSDGTPCPLGACRSGTCQTIACGTFAFDNAGDEQAWFNWTNCSTCTPGARARVGSAMVITSNTLDCTGTCMYPGVYTLSPEVPITGGEVIVRADTLSTGANAMLRLIFQTDAGVELGQSARPIPVTASLKTMAHWSRIPAGASQLQLRLEELSENSSLTIDNVQIDALP